MTNILTYDKLYSTDEIVALFFGTKEKAASLDRSIESLNEKLSSQYNLRPKLGIENITNAVELPTLPRIETDKIFTAYKLDPDLFPSNAKRGLYSKLKDKLVHYGREEAANVENNFPIVVEADDARVAEVTFLDTARERIYLTYGGNQELRGQEIGLYIQSLFYLAAAEKPHNIHIFDREHKTGKK